MHLQQFGIFVTKTTLQFANVSTGNYCETDFFLNMQITNNTHGHLQRLYKSIKVEGKIE